jgi:2-keto-4-pentenoate hydratase/2-oxohepta-3-ene-1,7-dioic acid hydratase in catechol pathway
MKLVTFSAGAAPRVGVVSADGAAVHDVDELLSPGVGVLDVIGAWDELGPVLRERSAELTTVPLASVELLAPIPVPRRNIWCVGKNYRDHAVEFGRSGYDTPSRSEALPDRPIMFSKATTAVTGPGALVDPGPTTELDYEGELTVIIGKGGRGISREDAYSHVWGYTIINDVTARDLQKRHQQWFHGKSLDTFCPMGPVLVTADEIPDPQALSVAMRINGETRQSSHTSKMIFPVDECIAVLSQGFTIRAGDVIATGTPEGVGAAPGKFLKAGDKMEAEVEKIGILANRIAKP